MRSNGMMQYYYSSTVQSTYISHHSNQVGRRGAKVGQADLVCCADLTQSSTQLDFRTRMSLQG
jgi:hypothetical protein